VGQGVSGMQLEGVGVDRGDHGPPRDHSHVVCVGGGGEEPDQEGLVCSGWLRRFVASLNTQPILTRARGEGRGSKGGCVSLILPWRKVQRADACCGSFEPSRCLWWWCVCVGGGGEGGGLIQRGLVR
jgi:hypothetical protein